MSRGYPARKNHDRAAIHQIVVRQSLGADFRRKSEIRKSALGEGKLELTEFFSSSFSRGSLVWSPTARIERPPFHRGGSASKGDQPGYPVFFCGSNNFPPFLNTAKIASEGQASKQSRQLSRQRDESNL